MLTRVGAATRRALLLLPLAASAAAAQASLGGLTLRGTGAGTSILDGQVTSSSITISGFTDRIGPTSTNQTVSVRLNNLVHTWASDVTASIGFASEELGTTIFWDLFARPGRGVAGSAGTSRDFNGSYAFGETDFDNNLYTGDLINEFVFGPSPILPSGDYFAFNSFSGQDYGSPGELFGGLLPNGVWTLFFFDAELFDQGSVASWDLAFNVVPASVPEPSSIALIVIGAAGLAAARRRRAR